MANIYDELAAANAQAAEDIARTGKVSDETAQRLSRANAAIAQFDAKVQAVTKATGSLYQTFTTYNRAVTDGVKGYKDLASTTDQLAQNIELVSAALAFILPIGRLAKVVVAGFGLLAGELVRSSKAIGEQIDGLRAGFDELAQVGGTTAGGLTDMFEAMQKAGLSVRDFPQFAKALGEQSTLLSRFGGTVNDGRNAVLGLSDDLKPMRGELQNFGIRVEQIGEASLGFIKTQKLASLGSKTSMDISTKSMMSYVKELDTITRLTGISRKEQEKTMEEAMRNDAFAATIDEMRARGDKEQADVLMKNLAFYKKMGPVALKGYMDSVSGFVGVTDEGTQLFQSSNGAVQDQIDKIKAGAIKIDDLAESNKDVQTAMADVAETISRGAAQLGTQFGLPYTELRNAIEGATQDVTKALGNIAIDQNKTDELLKKNNELMIKMQEDMMRNQQLLQSQALNYAGAIDGVTAGLSKLGTAAIEAAEKLGLIGGKKNVMGAVSSAVQGDLKGFSRSGGAEMVGKVGGGLAGMKAGAAMGAGFGAAFGGIGAVPGAIIGGGLGLLGGGYIGGKLGERADEETGRTASNENPSANVLGKTQGVNPALIEKLGMAASELGKTVSIVSGERSFAKQAELYLNYITGRSKFPAAAPGFSKHERGQAVDIDEGLANELDKNGLLEKYGLYRPVPRDPVHIEIAKYEDGGTIGAGKLGLVGEKGKPEIVQGPATVSSNNDIMETLKNMVDALDRSTMVLERIERSTSTTADVSDRMLRLAQN